MTFTSTDCSTVWMVDITCFNPGIGSSSTIFSATSNPFMTEASTSEDLDVREPSAAGAGPAGGIGERGRKYSLNHSISRSNRKSDDPI